MRPVRPRRHRPEMHRPLPASSAYATAAALADDLRRFHDGKPVHARRWSPGHSAARLARWQPGLILAAVGLVMFAGLAAWWKAGESVRRVDADRQREELLRREFGIGGGPLCVRPAAGILSPRPRQDRPDPWHTSLEGGAVPEGAADPRVRVVVSERAFPP